MLAEGTTVFLGGQEEKSPFVPFVGATGTIVQRAVASLEIACWKEKKLILEEFLLAFWGRGLGEVFDFEGVVVIIPFAAVEDGFGDFFEGEVLEGVGLHAEGSAADEEGAVGADRFGEGLELRAAQVLGGDVDEVGFGGMTVLPKVLGAGRVGEALDLTNGLGEEFGIELGVDDLVVPLVFLDEGGGEFVVAEATAAKPDLFRLLSSRALF